MLDTLAAAVRGVRVEVLGGVPPHHYVEVFVTLPSAKLDACSDIVSGKWRRAKPARLVDDATVSEIAVDKAGAPIYWVARGVIGGGGSGGGGTVKLHWTTRALMTTTPTSMGRTLTSRQNECFCAFG